VIDQPHFLAVLPLGEESLYPLNRSLGASQSLCGRFGAGTIFYHGRDDRMRGAMPPRFLYDFVACEETSP